MIGGARVDPRAAGVEQRPLGIEQDQLVELALGITDAGDTRGLGRGGQCRFGSTHRRRGTITVSLGSGDRALGLEQRDTPLRFGPVPFACGLRHRRLAAVEQWQRHRDAEQHRLIIARLEPPRPGGQRDIRRALASRQPQLSLRRCGVGGSSSQCEGTAGIDRHPRPLCPRRGEIEPTLIERRTGPVTDILRQRRARGGCGAPRGFGFGRRPDLFQRRALFIDRRIGADHHTVARDPQILGRDRDLRFRNRRTAFRRDCRDIGPGHRETPVGLGDR